MPLILAFLPSAMLLLLVALGSKHDPPLILLGAALLLCVGCCFTSSFMLFRHGKAWAVLVGILFLLLNLVVSFLFGCVALASQMKF